MAAYLPLTTYHLLLTTYYLLLTTHYSLLTTYYLLLRRAMAVCTSRRALAQVISA